MGIMPRNHILHNIQGLFNINVSILSAYQSHCYEYIWLEAGVKFPNLKITDQHKQ